jgi:serine/threonine-protein kinase
VSEENVTLGGRYTLGRVLGQGGMAEVFLAEDTRLHRTVAVKVLRSDLARDANFQERFRREAQSAAALNHPSIVAVYDTGEEQETAVTGADVTIPYIVMEYVEGDTLREFISPEHPMDAAQAGEIMAALLSALEYSHRAGIVHRDIKPGNIMINSAGAVKVMDFGIARAIADAASAMTATQAVMGTAQYLSPEQARGQLVDARSDIYSAACVMYEMLTGRPPFTGDTPVSIAYQHVREEPLAPSSYNPAITPAMDAVILTGLAKDRDQRYASAVAFSRDIAAVVAGREPQLVGGAVPLGSDAEATTVLSSVSDQTEALPAYTATTPVAAASPAPVATSPRSPLDEIAEEDEKKEKRPWWLIILVILAVLAVLGAMLWFFLPRDTGPEMVPVPAVAGQTEEEVSATLDEAGLTPQFSTEESGEVDEGLAISSNPPEGTEVEVGSTVEVVISAGPEAVEVPDIVDMSQEDAEAALAEVDLTLEVISQENRAATAEGTVIRSEPTAGSSAQRGDVVGVVVATGVYSVPDVSGLDTEEATAMLKEAGFEVSESSRVDPEATPGTVVTQNPAANQEAEIGSTVSIVIASEPGPLTMPNVTGQTLEDASARLSEEGLGVQQSQEASDSVPEGRVIRTEPAAGEEVERNSTVTVVISTGPAQTTPPPTPTPTPTPTEDPEPTDPPEGEGPGVDNG